MRRHVIIATTLALAAVLASDDARAEDAAAAIVQPQVDIGELGADGLVIVPQSGEIGLLAPQEIELLRSLRVALETGEDIGPVADIVFRGNQARVVVTISPELGFDYEELLVPVERLRVSEDGLVLLGYDLATLETIEQRDGASG